MKQKIISKEEMLEATKKGVTNTAKVVKTTLGPGGKTILIQRLGQALNGEPLAPIMTKDGVSVANECASSDENENLVIQSIKAICQKTNRRAGDGTTTAIVLGEALLNATLAKLAADTTLNAQLVKLSLDEAVAEVITKLDEQKQTIDDLDIVEQVANISANGDSAISSVIRTAFEEVGAEGVITVDEGGGRDTIVEIVKGFQVRRGSELKERFFNDQAGTKFEAHDVRVILYDGVLNNPADALAALKCVLEDFNAETGAQNRILPPTFFVANDFSMDVLTFLLTQKIEGSMTVCAIKSPHATHVRTAMLDDLAILLGGNRLGAGTRTLSAIKPEDIGRVKRIVCDKYTTTFYDGWGDEEGVLDRIDSLKLQREQAESPHDAALLSDRISSLNQAVAKIGVGGSTDMEIKEKYHRIEDALNAARAAIEDGVIPGGGTTLLRLALALEAKQNKNFFGVPRNKLTVGEEILIEALKAPFRQILDNIGQDSEIILKQLTRLDSNIVYNARTKKFVDAFAAGILDPVKVTKEALLNATSIASLLSTCGGGIVFSK